MNGWIIRYFDLPTLCCRLMRYLGFVPRPSQVHCRGLSKFALVEVQVSEMGRATLFTHRHSAPCYKRGGHASFHQHNARPFVLCSVSQSSPYPTLLAFLLLPCTLPAWAPTRALGFSQLPPSPSLPRASRSACSPQGE